MMNRTECACVKAIIVTGKLFLKTKVMESHVHGEFNVIVIRHEDNNKGSFMLKLDLRRCEEFLSALISYALTSIRPPHAGANYH